MTADAPAWKGGWLNRLVARPGFQSWAAHFPLTRGRARADGAALFEVVQGFVQSQVLMALAVALPAVVDGLGAIGNEAADIHANIVATTKDASATKTASMQTRGSSSFFA